MDKRKCQTASSTSQQRNRQSMDRWHRLLQDDYGARLKLEKIRLCRVLRRMTAVEDLKQLQLQLMTMRTTQIHTKNEHAVKWSDNILTAFPLKGFFGIFFLLWPDRQRQRRRRIQSSIHRARHFSLSDGDIKFLDNISNCCLSMGPERGSGLGAAAWILWLRDEYGSFEKVSEGGRVLKNAAAMTSEREALRLGIEYLTVLFPTEVSSFNFQVESTDRTVQYKLNAQSLRHFGLHGDVNDAHRAGANRLQNNTKYLDPS